MQGRGKAAAPSVPAAMRPPSAVARHQIHQMVTDSDYSKSPAAVGLTAHDASLFDQACA